MLTGKNVLITGARRGIGRASVEVFAKNGANIWACARLKDDTFIEDMAKLSAQYGVWIEPVFFDIMNEIEMKNAIQGILKQRKPIHILVNNAGTAQYDRFALMPFDHLEAMLRNNYIAPLRLTQLLSRRMPKNSSIVFLSSIAGLRGELGNLAYGGSKAAIAHAVAVLSRELASQEIRVNAVAPGMVDTDMKNSANPDYWQQLVSQIYLKRMARPEEIANIIAFLASDLSSYINGQVIRADGGLQ